MKPLDYYSAALSPSQRHYSAGPLETWAAITATRKWSMYLNGAEKVVVHTDHSALKWLQAQKDPKPTIAKWLMELQGLNVEIAVRPGSENKVADYLSQNPAAKLDEGVNSEDDFEDQIFLVEHACELAGKIADEQSRDVIKDAIKQLRNEGQVVTGGLKRVGDRLSIIDDKLRFKGRFVLVPKTMREEVHA